MGPMPKPRLDGDAAAPGTAGGGAGSESHGGSARLRLTLRQCEVFVATALEGSTRGAASRIARSQSAASTALIDLEQTLGERLFDRIGRGLVLNENGRAMLPHAQALIDRAAELQSLFADEHRAPLRMAASFTIGEYLLPERVARWSVLHPASPLSLRIGNTREVIASVAAFDVDLGFIEGPQSHPDLIVHPWLRDELLVVAAPTHPLARGTATRRQLAAADWVLREQGSGTRQVTDAWLMRHLRSPRIGLELGSTEAIKRVVAQGAGLGFLSRHAVAQALAEGTLVEVRTTLPDERRILSVVVHRNKRLGRTTAAFAAHCGVSGLEGATARFLPAGRRPGTAVAHSDHRR
ncbi:MAG: LysR family transcriptional regulator [Lautropia sp.]